MVPVVLETVPVVPGGTGLAGWDIAVPYILGDVVDSYTLVGSSSAGDGPSFGVAFVGGVP